MLAEHKKFEYDKWYIVAKPNEFKSNYELKALDVIKMRPFKVAQMDGPNVDRVEFQDGTCFPEAHINPTSHSLFIPSELNRGAIVEVNPNPVAAGIDSKDHAIWYLLDDGRSWINVPNLSKAEAEEKANQLLEHDDDTIVHIVKPVVCLRWVKIPTISRYEF